MSKAERRRLAALAAAGNTLVAEKPESPAEEPKTEGQTTESQPAPQAEAASAEVVVPPAEGEQPAPPTIAAGCIKLKVSANPKKVGSASHARFALYVDGMTIAAYKQAVKDLGQAARLAAADLIWDEKHEFIEITK